MITTGSQYHLTDYKGLGGGTYRKTKELEGWAINRHRTGKLITVRTILRAGFYNNEKQVRNALKRTLKKVLFPVRRKPQRYKPMCLMSEICRSKNTPLGKRTAVTGGRVSTIPLWMKMKRSSTSGVRSPADLGTSAGHIFTSCNPNYTVHADAADSTQKEHKPSQALIHSLSHEHTQSATFLTAGQFLDKEKSRKTISTGCRSLNDLLSPGPNNGRRGSPHDGRGSGDRGIECDAVTEFYGESSTGKTQICFTLCVMAKQQPHAPHERGAKVLYLDTEGTFRARRILSIAEARGLPQNDLAENIFHAEVTCAEQLANAVSVIPSYIKEKGVGVVIVDSIISPFRGNFGGRENLPRRQQRLLSIAHELSRIALKHDVAVVVTNQVQSKVDSSTRFFDCSTVTHTGGHSLAHAFTHRILLKHSGKNKIARVVDSPSLPEREVLFKLDHRGITDCEEL